MLLMGGSQGEPSSEVSQQWDGLNTPVLENIINSYSAIEIFEMEDVAH